MRTVAISDKRARSITRQALNAIDKKVAAHKTTFEGSIYARWKDDERQAAAANMKLRENAEMAATGSARLLLPARPITVAERTSGNREEVRAALEWQLRDRLSSRWPNVSDKQTGKWAVYLAQYMVDLADSVIPRSQLIEAGAVVLVNLAAGRNPHDRLGVVKDRLRGRGLHRSTVYRNALAHGPAAESVQDRKARRRAMIARMSDRGWGKMAATRYIDRCKELHGPTGETLLDARLETLRPRRPAQPRRPAD